MGAGPDRFERLQNRLHRRGAGARQAAIESPAYFLAFDLWCRSGTGTAHWPYLQRRDALEELFRQQW
ncbi:hypothetical protein [Streptomyces sp. NPDC017940]|uniref:hypothetical protein n=1 Tax=Streptomyces sp. NPDC017940 TaxID=3365017 RepID=UPI0037A8AAA7